MSKKTETKDSKLTAEDRALTAGEIADIRCKATKILQGLDNQQKEQHSEQPPLETNSASHFSWIRQQPLQKKQQDGTTVIVNTIDDDNCQEWLTNRTERGRYFDANGFLLVRDFVDADTVKSLKSTMEELANHDWDPLSKDNVASFGTDVESNTARGDYFLDSSNRIHYFAEPQALDPETSKLKDAFQNNKLAALNKAGHAMHIIPGPFQDYALSKQVHDLVLNELGWQDPVVPQSMYIFKQPRIGGTVHSHQDSSFLYTTPKQSCLGLWLALDDATLENGCLWVRPGSHVEPVRRQFVRNPDYFNKKANGGDPDSKSNPEATRPPKLIFEYHHDNPAVTWEGGIPTTGNLEKDSTTGETACDSIHESLFAAGFVPVECKAGDLVTFCGLLDHLSLPNYSNQTRHTFQLHLVEGPKVGVTWSPKNWLQYPPGAPFLRLVQ